MEKLKVGKYKNFTFKEVKEKINENDKNYLSYLKSYLNKDKSVSLKKNIEDFLDYYNKNDTIQDLFEKPEEIFIPKINVLKDENQEIHHLIHLSDIHIRLYKRSQEYLNVFNETYEEIKKINNKVIVITGDLLHYKNQLSPECIILTQNFLKTLSDLAPVILIAGNHDALLSNSQRIDSISAIIGNLNLENLYYLKNTGVFVFNNLRFSVNSLLDNHWIYHKNIPSSDKIDIALYHGGVGKVDTGVGYRLRGEKLVSDFEGFNYVLLGDIHKYQFLVPNMAYAGSLISQNFNEWNFPHGFIKWDVINSNHEFVSIKNKCGYFVFNLKNNNLYVNDELIAITQIKNYFLETNDTLEIKLQISNSTPEFIFEVSNKIKECGTDVKIYQSYLTDEQSSDYDFQNQEHNLSDSNLIDILTDLIKKRTSDQNDIKYILNQYENLIQEVNINQDKNMNKWEIIDLEFSNMFGYGENNFIDFTRFNNHSVIGLFASNGFGKSSLIDIILFTLFGKISRFNGNGISKDIINIDKTTFSSKIRFKIGSYTYVISKKGKREHTGKIKILDENFLKMENDVIINLEDESRIKTDKIISNEIGSYDEFIFTNVQLQNRDKSFKDMTNLERKDYLYKVFKLNIYEDVIKKLSPILKELNNEISVLKKISSLEEKEKIKNKLININSLINQKNDELNEFENKLEKNKLTYHKKTSKLKINPNDILPLKEKSSKLKNKRKNLINSIENLLETINENSNKEIDISHLEEKNNELMLQISNLKGKPLIPTSHLKKKNINLSFQNILSKRKEISLKKGTLTPNYDDIEKLEDRLIGIKIYETRDVSKELKMKLKEKKIVLEKIRKFEIEMEEKRDLDEMLERYEEERELREEEKRVLEKIELNNTLIDRLEKHEYNPKCKYCLKNPVVIQAKEAKEENFLLKKKKFNITVREFPFERMKTLEEIEKKYLIKKTKLENLKENINNLEEEKEKYEKNKKNQEKYDKLKKLIDEERKKKSEYEKNMKNIEEELKKLDEMIEIKTELEEIEKENQLIEEKNKEIEEIKNEKMNKLEEIRTTLKYQQDLKMENIKLKSSYNEKVNELEILEKELNEMLKKLKEVEELDENDLEKINNLKEEINVLENEIKTFCKDLGSLKEKKIHLEEKEEEMDLNLTDLKEKEKDLNLLKILEKILGKDGLPLYLLEQYLPLLTKNVNEIIEPFMNRKIEIKLDGEKVLFESFNRFNEERSVQIHGGMESFMMDLAFKITIGRYAKMSKCNTLFIDEGISALDKDKISNIDTLFEFLKNHFNKIILITHLDTVKDNIIEKIEIEKEDNFSKIKCIYSN